MQEVTLYVLKKVKYEGKNTRTIVTSYIAKVKYTGTLEKQVKDTTTFTAKYKEVESVKPETKKEENKVIPQDVVGTTGILCVCGIVLLNSKNVKIYNLIDGEYKLVKKAHISESKMIVNLTPYNYQSRSFARLNELVVGDIVKYKTKFYERTYKVDNIQAIFETDWSLLENTKENKITMITCIPNRREQRLCVQATEMTCNTEIQELRQNKKGRFLWYL